MYIVLSLCTLGAWGQDASFQIEVSNPHPAAKADEPVVININELKLDFCVRSAVVMTADGEEIPSQLDDLDGDLRADEMAFVLNLDAKSKQQLSVKLSAEKPTKTYPARVWGTLLTRDAKKNRHAPTQSITVPGTSDVYSLVYGHGPMFESELVGYRIYFNAKQTIDPYGKFHKRLELKDNYFYTTNKQIAEGYGDDVLLVGNSGGIGALKGWDGTKATHIEPVAFRTERILATGPVRTIAEVEVKGWDYQGSELFMTQRYTLYAGHRDLLVEARFREPLKQEVFCAGVQNIKGTETVMDSDHQGLVGSWGRHWPVTDTVKYAKETIGIATYIPRKYVKQEVKDKDNFLYTLTAPGERTFHYYTMFTSRKETFGYADAKAWFAYMREWKEALEQKIEIKIL